MNALGQHHLMELYACDLAVIDALEAMRGHVLEAARKAGATVVSEVFHKFAPQGVTGVVVLAESHLAVHSWPEHGYVAVDIFGCGKLDFVACLDHLRVALGASSATSQCIARGDLAAIARHAALTAR